MNAERISPIHHEQITQENLWKVIQGVSMLREEKGKSEEVLAQIKEALLAAKELQDFSAVVNLYQEQFLAAHHITMEEKAKGKLPNLRTFSGFVQMWRATRGMETYRSYEDVDPLLATRTTRFVGRFAENLRDYKKAEENYLEGLKFFKSTPEPSSHVNRLEYQGFLASI